MTKKKSRQYNINGKWSDADVLFPINHVQFMAIRVKQSPQDLSCAEFWHQKGVQERGGEYFLDEQTGTVRLVKMQGQQLLLDL